MKKNILLIPFLTTLTFAQTAFANQTQSYYFTGVMENTKAVSTNGGNLNATIDTSTGVLSKALTPGFIISTNTGQEQDLTISAKCQIQGGTTPAILNISSAKYIVLTNSAVLPSSSSVNDITTTTHSPTPSLNPNAIAYGINDPATATGLTVGYNMTTKVWYLQLKKNGQTPTSITIPAAAPLSGTYSVDDEPGDYKATITLSFD